MMKRFRLALALLLLAAVVAASPAAAPRASVWPQFRGPTGSGIGDDGSLPRTWSTRENVRWVTEIPGRGWSSPIVWEDQVFVTAAINVGDFKEPTPGIYGNDYMAELIQQGMSPREAMAKVRERDTETSAEVQGEVRWVLYGLDVVTGELRWEREVHRGTPVGGRHRKNTYASETPATDGQRVYVYIGNIGVYAFSMQGEPLWAQPREPRQIYLDFGTASSPVVHEGVLYVLHDNQELSTLAALDAANGEPLWQIERDNEHPLIRSGFSTPFIWRNELRTEVVAVAPGRVVSYSVDGSEVWRLNGTSMLSAPMPVAEGDRLYVGNGSPSENERPIHAVSAGANGDISPLSEGADNPYVLWRHDRGGSYITSPIAYRGQLYVVGDTGILAAYDGITGERRYRARVGRGNTFSASPWAADGVIYALSEGGTTFLIEAGDTFAILAENALDEMSLATPAIAHGSLFIRTATRLYRVQE